MRQRAIIQVSGPEGSGKTAFIEALIHAFDESDVACVRAFADASVRTERESSPQKHPELRRWRQAGASAVALYRFNPGDPAAADAFFLTEIMDEYSKVMVIEGDCPLEYVDLVGATGKHRMDPALMESLLQHPVTAPPGTPGEKWQPAAGYEGIEKAGLVIGNLHRLDEQPQVAPFLDEVARLRRDKAIFDDVVGWRGGRVPITAVAGSVLDLKDAGLKKALARVRRAVRSIG